jgi:hypothetical protein
MGTARARHGHRMLRVNRPLLYSFSSMGQTVLPVNTELIVKFQVTCSYECTVRMHSGWIFITPHSSRNLPHVYLSPSWKDHLLAFGQYLRRFVV